MPDHEHKVDYEKLYHTMVDASERALELLEKARRLLIDAERAAEERCIEA